MPATLADIAAGTRDAVTARWSSDAIAERYPSARDGSSPAAEGWFDAVADAQAVVDARGTLIGVERRRFSVSVDGAQWIDPTTGIPSARLLDPETGADGTFLIARLELDLDAETSTLELFG